MIILFHALNLIIDYQILIASLEKKFPKKKIFLSKLEINLYLCKVKNKKLNKNKKKKEKKMAEKTFREELEAMSVGDSKEYSMDNVLSIRSQCSMYGMSWNKIFQCKSDRETRIVKVTRIK